MRLTEAGDPVRLCRSSHPDQVRAACVGDTLFWVNHADRRMEVRVEGLQASYVRIMTEDTLSGDGGRDAMTHLAEFGSLRERQAIRF